jgi:replicative DNA helicase
MPPQETIEKLPPQNLEAEMAVLGSMLLDREATALAIEMLNQSYFYKDAHKKIYYPTSDHSQVLL